MSEINERLLPSGVYRILAQNENGEVVGSIFCGLDSKTGIMDIEPFQVNKSYRERGIGGN
jgi:predicted N-acetyltransferase YhbS